MIFLDLREGRPWDELDDEDANAQLLYQIMQNNEDTVESNNKGEIYLGLSHVCWPKL